jgi:hypothetical protein
MNGHMTIKTIQSIKATDIYRRDAMPLVAATAIFFVTAVLLLLHHGWHHAQEDPETSAAQRESCAEVCYFQD